MIRFFLRWELLLVIVVAFSGCSDGPDMPYPPMPSRPQFDASTATARVFGNVVFEGMPPDIPAITVGGDPLCKMNALNIWKSKAMVTSDGKLRNTIVYVRSGYEGRAYPVPTAPVVLDQQGCIYTPHVFTVMKGQKVRILNSDETFHNVHAQDGTTTEFNIAQASKGVENTQTFSRAVLPFRIGCDLHKWMAAYAGVFEHPFHTTSGERGSYELRLPAGKYEIVAWHEKFGEQSSNLEVQENGAAELDFKFTASAGR
jgi:plastocyanin